MANLLDSVENSVWHAFDYLALDGDGTAPKTKLKSLTSQIGAALDLDAVDNGIDDFRSTSYLSFDQYRYYLFREVFSALPDEMPIGEQHNRETKIDGVCWTVCARNFVERDNPVFPEDCVEKLFRLFCMLGDMVENDNGMIEVVMAASEVEVAISHFMKTLGQAELWDPEEFDSVASVIPAFKFGIFLTVLESKYVKDVDEGGLREAVRDVHDLFVLDVIKKGHLGKKMDLLPAFREHYFVLQPHLLTFYNGTSQREKRGEIPINSQCRVEACPDSNSKSPIKTPGSKHHSKFQLFANQKVYDFQATDHRTRLQWINAFRTAFENSDEPIRYQRQQLTKRKLAREEAKEKEEDEEMINMLEQTKDELEQEKQARVNAEEQAATLMRERKLEEKRLKELESIRDQLEGLLEEERQAKKDEETVRTLQARILNEEWERRAELERLQEEQKALLEEERKKRAEFEKQQAEKERELREAKRKVEEMENEKTKLGVQLDKAQDKAKKATIGQEILEAKIKVKEQDIELERDKDSSRANSNLHLSASFYCRNRDRPSYTPMRSASMRETSYSRSIRRQRHRNNDTLSVTTERNIEEVNNNGNDEE